MPRRGSRQLTGPLFNLRIIEQFVTDGAEGVIEGCTEIVMLVKQEHTDTPLFDTTAIHAQEAVAEALR